MRVVHIVPSISEEASGPSYSVRRLCDALVGMGVCTTLLTLDLGAAAETSPYLKKFPLGIGPRRVGRSPAMNTWLAQGGSRREFDILHAHGMWMMPNVYPGRVAAGYRLPLVVSPRGCFTPYAMSIGSKIKRVFWPLVQRPALSAVSCFHATAESEYLDIRRLGFKQPVAIIPNGIDERASVPPVDGCKRTILYLGRIHPEKGVAELLRAWQLLESRWPEWSLRIVGPGQPAHVREAEALAARLGLARCEFAGPLYGAGKWEAYQACHLYVLPSPSENFAVTVAEALMAGRPVIATKGSPWSGLETHRAGWWVDIGVEPLVAALSEALSTPTSQLAAMGARGRDLMLRNFTWDMISSEMAAVYSWLLDRGPRPAKVLID